MNCLNCGHEMTTGREDYPYDACGLPNVTLAGVEVRRCAACGEHEVVIPAVESLHQALATAVIERREKLLPIEVRYLRKYLGLAANELATQMGVTPETVSRWENGAQPMGAVAERLLRLMVAQTNAEPHDTAWLADVARDETPALAGLKVAAPDWRIEPFAVPA